MLFLFFIERQRNKKIKTDYLRQLYIVNILVH